MNRCRLSAAAADGVVIVEVLFRPFDEFPPLFILLVSRGPPPYDFNPPLVTSTLLYLLQSRAEAISDSPQKSVRREAVVFW
jgi:hypothetical protein